MRKAVELKVPQITTYPLFTFPYTSVGRECKRVRCLFDMFKVLGLVKENGVAWELTLQGAFWIHLAQNYFSLNYINKV